MAKTLSGLIVIAAVCMALTSSNSHAQEVIFNADSQLGTPYHVVESDFSGASVTGRRNHPRQRGLRRLTANKASAKSIRPSQSPANSSPLLKLPAGRRYIFDQRYFGNINNRFYGPQYGNF